MRTASVIAETRRWHTRAAGAPDPEHLHPHHNIPFDYAALMVLRF
jgi:hypothetical protein